MNNENEIEAILADRKSYFLHKIIDSDEPFCPIIDFDLPREVYNSIEPKLKGKEIQDLLISAVTKVYLEIFLK